MPLDFLFLYEHVVREYESILLVGEELARRGYSYEIRQLLDRKKLKYFTYKKPRVLVTSCLYDNEGLNSHVYNNVGKCKRVLNLHWEQMLSESQENQPWFNFEGNAKNCVQTCWGKATKNRLMAHGLSGENTPVTGAVMMDFLRPQFDGYFLSKRQLCLRHGLNPQNPLWLYISSFGYASMQKKEVDELSRMAGTDFAEFAEVNKTSMEKTLAWFGQFLAKNPSTQLVYRPHPSEWQSKQLAEMCQKHKNFKVIFEDSVKQWLVAADSIFIWMSSAIAEVYFAKKSCHILRPSPIPCQFDPVIYKNASFIKDYASFEAAAQNPAPPFPIKAHIIEDYFESDQSVPAYKNMANLLVDIYKNPPRGNVFAPGFSPKFNWLKFFALIGVQAMFFLRFNPARLAKIAPGFAGHAGRIYAYIEKAHLPKQKAAKMRKKIKKFL